ncbi:dihydrodipicolinate synthase family protein [Conservatibacter flavescens]|uniref:Dihydrodipicolinate synthase family protein n=1 Tax=Conservatibacter flavescens TaxID=28161 RepID=A0A2M8RZJ9_9PAST|nr:dihydrodipicolinate synthase family protein [Conservatibacter flavescens]PJG84317.1 dihydrodipicolinate synthase family protein [Conservatibacter flavescens]
MEQDKYIGIWPVMLTPFDHNGKIDWLSLERLINWYIASGVHGLFAACQSSEMFFLTDQEKQALIKFVLDVTDKRIPIVASGHTADDLNHQIEQLQAVADLGVDAVILISNRLAAESESDEVFLQRLNTIVDNMPTAIDLGIYECPYPYKRLLSKEIIQYCITTNQFTFIKDTCCNLDIIKERLNLTKNSRLNLANANSQTFFDSLKLGCKAYSGVMANFHPELYVWLYKNIQHSPEKAKLLSQYLSISALIENLDYPVCAKYFQYKIGNFNSIFCRSRNSQLFHNTFFPAAVDDMIELGANIQSWLEI